MTSEADLKKVSRELRARASKAVNASPERAPARIRRLLDVVEDTELLRQEVERAPEPECDVLGVLEECRENRKRLPVVNDELEHLGFLHSLLVELAQYEGDEEDFWEVGWLYAGATGSGDGVEELLHDVVPDYSHHLETLVVNQIIDTASEKDQRRGVRYRIDQSGAGQINIAEGGGQLEAYQQGQDASEVMEAVVDVLQAAQADTELDPETRTEIVRLATRAQFELQEDKPSRSTLEQIHAKLKEMAGVVGQGAALAGAVDGLIGTLGALL